MYDTKRKNQIIPKDVMILSEPPRTFKMLGSHPERDIQV
jgi:hypothetical protein